MSNRKQPLKKRIGYMFGLNKGKQPLKKRISYWFDNKMAQGFWPKVRLLLLMTIIFVVLVGLLSAFSHGNIRQHFGEDFIRTFMYSVGKGGALNTDDTGISIGYFLLMLLAIIYCIFFTAILIGLISNALRTKVDDLGKGRSNVIENDHTLILGFNDATFVFLEELIEANKNQLTPHTVVILDETDQSEMIDQIKKRIGWPKKRSKTRIVCRTGSIYNFSDLRRCSLETSRSVVVNSTDDFEAIKAIMACSHLLKNLSNDEGTAPFIVSVIQSEESLIEARLAARGKNEKNVIILALNKTLARIMVHTSRQPGLSDVFTEVFNFSGSEFYIMDDEPCYPSFYGKNVVEINRALQDSYIVGIQKKDGKINVAAPSDMTFEKGDSLIVVKEDDDPLITTVPPADATTQWSVPVKQPTPVDVLIIGVQPVLGDVLLEYVNYLPAGSSICIVDSEDRFSTIVDEDIRAQLNNSSIQVSIESLDTSHKKQANQLLNSFTPDCVLVLADEDSSDPNAEDERIMRTLIYLREYRDRAGRNFSITCEMLLAKNKELAAVTEPDDFIISRQFSALMMAQISQDKDMAPLFDTLLSSEGFEIYIKPAHWYIPIGEPVNLVDVYQMVAKKGDIFIGVRQKKNGRYQVADINPVKYDVHNKPVEYVFGEDDYLVVLADDIHFPEY